MRLLIVDDQPGVLEGLKEGRTFYTAGPGHAD